MNLSTAPEKAKSLGPGARAAAAHHYNSIEHELELGQYTEDEADAGEKALEELERRFPGVRQAARSSGRPPALSHSAGRKLNEPGERRPGGHPRAGGRRARGGQARARSTGSYRPRAGRSTGRRFQQTGIPAAAESTSQLLMRTIGGLVGLSLVYLLVSPRGSRAVELGGGALTHSIQALVSPAADPLQPSTSPAARKAAHRGNPTNQPVNVANAAVAGTASVVAHQITQISHSIGTGAHKPRAGGTHP